MKSKGFTLIELLAVISILSLLALITSMVVSNSLREAKKDLTETQVKSIKLAAQAWGADNINKLPTGNSCGYITLQDLIDDGYLESKIISPDTKEEISTDLKIKISSQQSKKNLIYEVNSQSINECSYIGQIIRVDLPKGLTPVVYDEDKKSWRVPNTNEEWYNYDEQMWANAVVLGKGKIKNPGEIVTVEGENPETLMMLVYIPRYEYKIEGDFGKGGQSAAFPGEIEINFILKTEKGYNAASGYRVHPAFTFGDQDINGFWVGKFELSSVGENLSVDNNLGCNATSCTSDIASLTILPNKESLSYNNISNFWYGIKSIENTNIFGLSNIDSHMIKNSEWGAVAYLSQSKYGKYGNSDYDNEYKEVYQNKDTGYVTGRSNGTPSQSDSRSEGQCVYNDMQDLGVDSNGYKMGKCGPGASTTGNIYGVYDMSGGTYEYVMGAYGLEYPEISSSGFAQNIFTSNAIEPKYYDLYANATDSDINGESLSCNNEICYGHAISETTNWYEDYAEKLQSNYSWFGRGGDSYSISGAGVFSRFKGIGFGSGANSTRFVGIRK